MKTHTNQTLPHAPALAALVLSLAALQPATAASWVTTGMMNTARWNSTATLLANAKVLVAGGFGSGYPPSLSSAELYDPATGTWTSTGTMTTTRGWHTATLLSNGQGLVAGALARLPFRNCRILNYRGETVDYYLLPASNK